MEARLVVIAGKASKPEVVLPLPAIIGRSRDADLTVAHPMVSRQHCELFEAEGRLMLRDLGSLNGTYLGGQRIQEVALQPQEEFTVGPITFRAEYEPQGGLAETPRVESGPAGMAALPGLVGGEISSEQEGTLAVDPHATLREHETLRERLAPPPSDADEDVSLEPADLAGEPGAPELDSTQPAPEPLVADETLADDTVAPWPSETPAPEEAVPPAPAPASQAEPGEIQFSEEAPLATAEPEPPVPTSDADFIPPEPEPPASDKDEAESEDDALKRFFREMQ